MFTVFTGRETMVEVTVLHFPASFIWHLGWSLHVSHGQHIWCDHLPPIRMGCSSSWYWAFCSNGLLHR